MTQAELFALMERFDKSSIAELDYKQGGESLLLRKAVSASANYTPVPTSLHEVNVTAATVATVPPAVANGRVIKAPLVGTYYASPSPDAPPFAAVGKTFKKGETVAVIEAMKMINEVPAPCDCTVEEVLVQNGALVGFGDVLLKISEKFE